MFKLLLLIFIVAFILDNAGMDKAPLEHPPEKPHPQQTHGEQVCPLPDHKQRLRCLDTEYHKIINEIRLLVLNEKI